MPDQTKPAAPSGDVEKVEGSEGPVITDPSVAYVPSGEGKGQMYAWSRFPAERDPESGIVTKWIKEGDKVSAGDLGLDDDQFKELVETGAVREQEYPQGALDEGLSPNEWYKKQLAIAAGEEIS